MAITSNSIAKLCNFRYWNFVGFAACVLFFILFPHFDLQVTRLFYSAEGFHHNSDPIVQFVYHLFAKIHFAYLIVLIAGIVIFSVKKNKLYKAASVYLLACLLIGPGILVNFVLKNHSVGRPRPVHIQEFGGTGHYTAPFVYSGACKRNCSFVSGHAAIGFFTMALAWVLRRRAWLITGIAAGAGLGAIRIIQGGHFLSDVVFSGWTVYFTCVGIAFILKPQKLTSEQS